MTEVKAIFEPQKVVLIGSTKIRENVGMISPQLFSDVIYNMRKFFRGKTYVLDLEGKAGPEDLKEIPAKPELAVIMLPPQESIAQAEECMKSRAKGIIIIGGGFKDNQRHHLLKLKEEHGTRILGPNTIMGVINTNNGLNTSFERRVMPKKGSIAVVSQSGGVGSCLLDWACFYNIGISKFVFVGDKIDVDDVDLLHYFRDDKKTKVICLYIEGIKKGQEFIKKAREIARRKPILVLKGGTTKESAKRARSHTASIASSNEVFDAALKKAGVIRAQTIEELMDMAVALSKQPPMRGDNVAIISNVGGPAILAADAIARNELKLAVLSDRVKRKIESTYQGVDATNPIDMIADARADRYEKVLDLVLADKEVDGAIVINMLKSTFFEPEDARAVLRIAAKYPDKPLVDVPAGGQDFARVYRILGNTRIPLYDLPDKAARALKALREYSIIAEKR